MAAGASSNGEPRQPGNGTRAGSPEETAAQYAVIAIVPVFCLMGLLGILVCNLLKRKGYHCTAQKEVGPGSGGGGSGKTWLGPCGDTRGFGGNLPGLGVSDRRELVRKASWRCCAAALMAAVQADMGDDKGLSYGSRQR